MTWHELRAPSGKLVALRTLRCGDVILQVAKAERVFELNLSATLRLGQAIVVELPRPPRETPPTDSAAG